MKKRRTSYWIHLLGLSTLLSLFPTHKALSTYPSLFPTTALLNINYDQCKTKANEIANLVFSQVGTPSEQNGHFRLFGTTSKTVSVLLCVRSDQGTYFVLSTSGGFGDLNKEAESLYQRINQYMAK